MLTSSVSTFFVSRSNISSCSSISVCRPRARLFRRLSPEDISSVRVERDHKESKCCNTLSKWTLAGFLLLQNPGLENVRYNSSSLSVPFLRNRGSTGMFSCTVTRKGHFLLFYIFTFGVRQMLNTKLDLYQMTYPEM